MVYAQKGRVLIASEQCWSGGIAGRHGCNYNFVVVFNNVYQEMEVDTIWIGDYAVKLMERTENNKTGNVSVKRGLRTAKYYITVSTYFDNNNSILENSTKNGITNRPPSSKVAAAVITYGYGGKRRYFAVPKILLKKAPLAYP